MPASQCLRRCCLPQPGRPQPERARRKHPPFHMKTVDVVKFAIPCLADDRQTVVLSARKLLLTPLDYRVPNHANAMSVRQKHRPFQKPRFLNPLRAGHLSIPVKRKDCSRNSRVTSLFSERKNRSHTRANRSHADDQLSFPLYQGCLADLDAGHVSDRVQFSRRSVKWNSEITGPHGACGNIRARAENEAANRCEKDTR